MSDTSIRLVLSDVDGTLITPDKQLTDEAIRVVNELRARDILFAITSSRPPRGLSMFVDPLNVTLPMGPFNGGLIVNPHLDVLNRVPIKEHLVEIIVRALSDSDVSAWVFQGTNWFVLDLDGPHVAHEASVVQFEPTQIESFDGIRSDVIKIVGVSDDTAAIAKAQAALNDYEISATTSQSYYLDITDRNANKGKVVHYLSDVFSIDRSAIATIGDMSNDVLMFQESGLSIAMGNATDEVKAKATHVTKSNDDNGFAYGIEQFVLGES